MKKISILLSCLAIFSFIHADGLEVVKNRGVQDLMIDGEVIHTTNSDIVNEKMISVTRATKVVTWTEKQEEKEVPFYSINLNGRKWTNAKKTSYDLMLKNYRFDPLKATRNQIASQLESRADCGLYIVQFVTQNLKEYQETLKQMGVEIHQFIPNHSFIIRTNATTLEAVKSLEFVRWAGPMHAAYKMEPQMFQNSRGAEHYNVVCVSKTDKQNLVAQLSQLGAKIINNGKGSILLVAELNTQQLIQAAHLETVLWIDEASAIEEDMDNARIQGGANYAESKFGSYTGIGIRGHILEGIYPEHQDFVATQHREAPIAVDDAAGTSHGHSTFGQIFGSGAGKAQARGILPDGQGYYTNYNAIYNGSGKGAGSRYELTQRLINEHKIMFQTASWGYSRTTEYGSRSAEMDDIIFNLDFPVCQSQSNAGDRMSRPQAWAKNIISGGALKHYNTANPEDDAWNRGASIGPATDGRIKPDLSSYYDGIDTTSRTGYTTFGGTSGATPIIAGHVGLTIQLWTDGIFGNELKAPKEDRFANRAHFTTTKALLINTAAQYSFQGTNHDRTRVHQGWGFPSVKNMIDLRNKILVVDEEDLLTNLDSKTYQVNVASGEPQFKVTLIWNEPAPSLSASKQLINNLNLKVTSPEGTVYHGNYGLLEGMYSKSGGEADNVDCVENVFVQNPSAGTWTIEVIADEINADNHLETSEVDVDYALVASGITK